MSEDYKLQVSIKVGSGMFNVRANTVAELNAILLEAEKNSYLTPFFGPPPQPAPVDKLAGETSQEAEAIKAASETTGTAVGPAAEEVAATEEDALALLKEQLNATETTDEGAPAASALEIAKARMKKGGA